MAVTEEFTQLDRQIIRQLEYYFGDYNLPKDKFLQESVKENDGWVTMETLLKFKRLADLSSDAKIILAAIKKSDSGLMEVDMEGDGRLRRSPANPLPENTEEAKKLLEAKTAYAKGFDKEKTTMDELLEYYAEHEPAIVHIQMRNYFDKADKLKHFKGSVFLTFRSEEACKEFINAEKKEYKEVQLIRKFQKDYLEEKTKEYEEKKKKRGEKKGKGEKNENEDAKEEDVKEEQKLPVGTVIKITGLGGEITREDIKEKLSSEEFGVNIDKDSGDIAFITYQKGETEAWIRFKVENYGKGLMEKMAKVEKIVIKEMEVKTSLLEGEEEEKFLAESLKDLKNHRARNKNNKRKFENKKGGRGGGGGGQWKKSRRN